MSSYIRASRSALFGLELLNGEEPGVAELAKTPYLIDWVRSGLRRYLLPPGLLQSTCHRQEALWTDRGGELPKHQ